MKLRIVVASICIVLFTIGGVILYGTTEGKEKCEISQQIGEDGDVLLQATGKDSLDDQQDSISFNYCYICGEVLSQGVYKVRDGSRVIDVLNEAGGFTENAAENCINLAERVYDGEMIYIPSKEEVNSGSVNVNGGSASNGLVNINTADLDTLMTLPGVGETKAKAIIDYRTRYGRFDSVDEITNVSGIGAGTLDKFRGLITI